MKNGSVPLPTHYFVLVTKDGETPTTGDGHTDDLSVTNVTSVLAVILDHQPTIQNYLVGPVTFTTGVQMSLELQIYLDGMVYLFVKCLSYYMSELAAALKYF